MLRIAVLSAAALADRPRAPCLSVAEFSAGVVALGAPKVEVRNVGALITRIGFWELRALLE